MNVQGSQAAQSAQSRAAKVALLDTNGLMHLHLYWEACRHAGVRLDQHTDPVQFIAAVEAVSQAVVSTYQLDGVTKETLRAGMKLFRSLLARPAWTVLASSICWAELRQNLLESQILDRLSRGRIPRRLQVKRPLVVFNRHLGYAEIDALSSLVDDFITELDRDYGIVFKSAEDYSGVPPETITRVAEAIWAHVLLDVMDSFIYASSVVCMADLFVSGDGSLTGVVKTLHSPNTSEWKAIVASLEQRLFTVLGGARYQIPRVIGPSDTFPL